RGDERHHPRRRHRQVEFLAEVVTHPHPLSSGRDRARRKRTQSSEDFLSPAVPRGDNNSSLDGSPDLDGSRRRAPAAYPCQQSTYWSIVDTGASAGGIPDRGRPYRLMSGEFTPPLLSPSLKNSSR
ncbi:MAG TPA: hypothetical protein PLX71_05400, partial [Phycicoccus sp.]|nr:hypothetical protein [Phycicoccus sp.]